MSIKLPDKPSELITLALHDLGLCEKDPDYEINMRHWHTAVEALSPTVYHQKASKCMVCFAGGLMAQTLKIPIGVSISAFLNEFDMDITAKISALDCFRKGWVSKGLAHLRIGTRKVKDRFINPYTVDHSLFKFDMMQLVRDFRKEGL